MEANGLAEDIKLWVAIAVSRYLRKLKIGYRRYLDNPDILPSSLYTCESLVVLKLSGRIRLDVHRKSCLPSLKTLGLSLSKYFDGKSLQRLLSICPVLEDLRVVILSPERSGDNMGRIIVNVLSLQRLSLCLPYGCLLDGLEIDTPSLEYLRLKEINTVSGSCLIENMPNLEKADLFVRISDIESLIGSITSVKKLKLSVKKPALYGKGLVFNRLEKLKLCRCTVWSSNLLARLLQDSPNLQSLHVYRNAFNETTRFARWNQPTSVPACFLSSLRTFIWTAYVGIPKERDAALYVLENASRLETATISSAAAGSVGGDKRKLETLKELSDCSRASATCQLFIR